MNLEGTAALYAITCGRNSAFARPWATWKRAPKECASAWLTPTDAFEKASAAMHAALCIMLRASSSREDVVVLVGRIRRGQRRDGWRVVHHAARCFVARVFIGDRQILERQPDGLHGVGIRISRRVDRNAGFERVYQTVDPRIRRQAF